MNKSKLTASLMAAAMIVMSGIGVEAQRLRHEDLFRIKSAQSTQVRTAPLSSPTKDADSAELQNNNSGETNKKAIVGSWLETVTFAGPNPMPPQESLSTFTEDGGLVVADQGSVTADVAFTPGHGAWKHLRSRTFAWTILEIIYDPVDGALIGYLKVKGRYILNQSENAYSGQFHAEISDPSGNVLFTVDGTNAGSRISVEALP